MKAFQHIRGFALLALLMATLVVDAQPAIRRQICEPELPDSIDIEHYSKKHFWRAAAMVTGLNVAVWSNDHFIQHADYAEISWSSIKENIKHGFAWDTDQLGTNMFLHPYHGSLYYNSARSNGFNYWQSGLFALSGSAMWELFFENEYPSTNDIIATPVGGMAIGEVTFRASDRVLKDNSTGWERFGREAAALLIAPTRGLTRIITGDAWRHRETTGRLFGIPEVTFQISTGFRLLGYNHNVSDYGGGLITEVELEYGDRYEMRSNTPYDYFTFRANLAVQRSQPVLSQINIMGRLISRGVIDTEKTDLSIGMYQHYDFYDSDTLSKKSDHTPYKLAVPASVGAGLMFHSELPYKISLDAATHVNGVALGGILSDHFNVNERNYNLGSGFSVKTGVNLFYDKDILTIGASYQYYRLFTWGYPKGLDVNSMRARDLNTEGDDSAAYFGIANLRASFRIKDHIYLTGEFTNYVRSTRYRDFPDVKTKTYKAKLMLTYKF